MPTPYDAIINLRERETDEAAEVMRTAAEHVAEIEARVANARESLVREAAFAAQDISVRSDLYRLRMQGEIAELETLLTAALAELDARREVLLQLVAETKALEQVAQNYREAQRLAEERAAQAQVDDRIGFLHGARLRAARSKELAA